MTRKILQITVAVLGVSAGVFSLSGWQCDLRTQVAPTIISLSRQDERSFRQINRATMLANLPELRKVNLKEGELEIRIWRGVGGLDSLEGVSISRSVTGWSGWHLKVSDHGKPERVSVTSLGLPRSGWQKIEREVIENGLLAINQSDAYDCEVSRSFDGITYLVEINDKNTYRNYFYFDAHNGCPESVRIASLGNRIGQEFDTGLEECRKSEWFACSTRSGEEIR